MLVPVGVAVLVDVECVQDALVALMVDDFVTVKDDVLLSLELETDSVVVCVKLVRDMLVESVVLVIDRDVVLVLLVIDVPVLTDKELLAVLV